MKEHQKEAASDIRLMLSKVGLMKFDVQLIR
jgi:hypothetical protein